MRIELHRAGLLKPEAFDRRDLPVRIVHPDTPVWVRSFTVPSANDYTEVLIGRYAGPEPLGIQWSWTEPVSAGPEEDADLSRQQLRLQRRNGRWELSVPGIARGDKPDATIQYWGSGVFHALLCAGPPTRLTPGSNVSAVVRTATAFYWALFEVPLDEGPQTAPRQRVLSGRPTTPSWTPAVDDPSRFPAGWEEAVMIKFRPFLSWPMGWQPALVRPSQYPPPPDDWFPQASPRERVDKWAESVKRRLGDLKAAAIRRGMSAVAPRVIDVSLLEWLVAGGELGLEQNRGGWMPVGYSPDEP